MSDSGVTWTDGWMTMGLRNLEAVMTSSYVAGGVQVLFVAHVCVYPGYVQYSV